MNDISEKSASGGLSSSDFQRFKDFFYRKTGIMFGDNKRYFVDRRLLQRMAATDSESFRAYLTLVKFQASQEEYRTLVDMMTVNETYFFREAFQFDCMVRVLLDECLRNRGGEGPLRIWSIPCSTGEEPYSIALYLLDRWPRIKTVDVEIVGTDISEAALAQARRGVYTNRSVEHVPAPILSRYFRTIAEDQHQIAREIRDVIDLRTCNLCDGDSLRDLGRFDIVFCRNLLIYFDSLSQKKAAEHIYDRLNPGGFVLLGHSESMSRISSIFRVRDFPEGIVYQRPKAP